jgi:hypothetical protein
LADEVEIVNFGEGGVASEATLASLVSAIEKLAASTGRDPKKEAGKLQELHNKATKSGVDLLDEFNDVKKEETAATRKATSAVNTLANRMQGAFLGAISSVAGGAAGLAKELISGGTSLGSFTQHLPIAGQALAPFVEYLDNTVESFRAMSAVGGAFNNNLEQMRLTSARMGVTLDEFQSLVINNSDALASLGGSVTQGALRFERINKNLKATGDFRSLMNMGFTVEEINEGMADYVRLQRNLGVLQTRSNAELADGSAGYLKTLDQLAKLTGKQRDQIAAEINERMIDSSMRTLRNAVEAAGGSVESFDTSLGLVDEVGGPYANAIKDLMDGTINDAEGTGKFLAMLGPAADQVRRDIEEAGRGADPTVIQRALLNAGQAIEQFGPQEAQARSSLIQAYKVHGDVMGDYFDLATRAIDIGRRDLNAVETEQGQTNETTENLTDFELTVRSLRSEIQTNLIESGIFSELATQVGGLNTALLEATPEITRFVEGVSKGFSNIIEGFNTGGLEGGLDALFDPSGPLAQAFERGISLLFSSMVEAIKSGIAALWESFPIVTALVGAIGTLFAVKKVVDIANGLKRFLGFDSPSRDRDRSRVSSRGAGGGAAGGFGREVGVGLRGLALGLKAIANPMALVGLGAMTLALMGLGKAIEYAAPGIEAFGGAVKSMLEGLAPVVEAFAPVIEALGGAIRSSFEGLAAVIESSAAPISAAFEGIGTAAEGIGAGLSATITAAGTAAQSALSGVATVIESSSAPISAAFNGISTVVESFGTALSAPIESAGVAIETALNGVSTVVDSIGTAITGSITAVGNSIATVITSINEYKTAGIEATTNQITTLADIPGDNLVTAARGLELMKTALEGFSPGFFESFGSFLLGGQGAQDQQAQVTFITSLAEAFESFNIPNISSASEALTSMGSALSALGDGINSQPNTGGLLGNIKTFFTGTAELPFDAIRSFEQQNFDVAKIRENANIIKQFGEIMQTMPSIPEAERSGGFFSAVGDWFSGAEDPLAPYALFGAYTLDGTAITSNLTAMQNFSANVNNIPQITNDLDSLMTKVNLFTKTGGRGNEFDWDKVVEFGNLNLGSVTNNAQVVKDLATKISEMPNINAESLSLTSLSFVELSKGVLALNEAAISELTIQEELVARLERVSTLGPGLGHTAESLQALANVEGLELQFNTLKEGLDTDAVRTYNDAIETLIDTIEDLKDALSDVSTMQASANTAMSNIQISAQNTTEGLGRLGNALDAVISEMRVANEYNKEINRNTKAITGNNVGTGYVSRVP